MYNIQLTKTIDHATKSRSKSPKSKSKTQKKQDPVQNLNHLTQCDTKSNIYYNKSI